MPPCIAESDVSTLRPWGVSCPQSAPYCLPRLVFDGTRLLRDFFSMSCLPSGGTVLLSAMFTKEARFACGRSPYQDRRRGLGGGERVESMCLCLVPHALRSGQTGQTPPVSLLTATRTRLSSKGRACMYMFTCRRCELQLYDIAHGCPWPASTMLQAR